MFISRHTFLSILTGAVAGAMIIFGLAAFRPQAIPMQAQAPSTDTATAAVSTTPAVSATPTTSPTPFNPGPEVEGPEIGEGISREGGFFINDLAKKLNVPVDVLESDITSALNDTNNQAVTDGFLDQATANTLATREASLFSSGSGFFFDIDEFPPGANEIPVTGATLTPTEEEVTATPTENESEENEKTRTPTENESEEQHEASRTPSPTLRPTHTASPTGEASPTPRPTREATHEPDERFTPTSELSATPGPSMTIAPTERPTEQDYLSLLKY
jgi:hypothetical protein